ncbi:MAG: tRNA-guanine transglycosylase, partial [Bryobacteraceae bacterium]
AGRVIIKHARYQDDPAPLDEQCACYTCRNFSRAYLRHLFQASEILFSTLATLHNLHYYMERMRRIRQAILEGRFAALLAAERSAVASAADVQ